MEIRQHEWLSASPHEGFEQMRLKSRPKEPSPSLTRVGANFYSSVKQQDYSASVWLRRKDKLEHSQQKCIVIFALVCCFAILVALIFSAVDIMGEDEDGLSEKNCQNKCRIALVENIPEGLNYSENAPFHLSLFQGWMNLLNMAKKSVDIVSSHWDLNHSHPSACQMKELGVIFYNCSCLVLDLQRIFALYSSLKFKNRVPLTWSKRLYGVYDNEKKLQLQLNETKSQAFVSNSPKLFCPKNRSFDIDAIY
uniref:Phospholipase D family member 5 n=1 Tax=Equus asinus TaxID=9793 RepID=A0A9L0IR89_EQUAS